MMEPWQSWGLFLATAGAIGYYYTKDIKPAPRGRAPGRAHEDATPAAASNTGGRGGGRARRRAGTGNAEQAANTVVAGAQAAVDNVASTAQTAANNVASTAQAAASTVASGAEAATEKGAQVTSKGKGKKNQPKNAPEPAGPSNTQGRASGGEKEEPEDKDWAERLAGLKKGTTLAAPARKEARSKTVKQTAAHAEPEDSKASSTSESAPSAAEPAPSGKDVSDMLEAAATGPSVLRVTESTKPSQANKPQQKKEAAPQETKKQRQNRRKVEEKKLQREQEEKERRELEEKQRRTAREARGEPAKNGLQPSKGPQNSAWVDGKGKDKVTAPAGGAQLLDTFEHDGHSTSSSNAPNSVASTATTGANFSELPPEEEQVRLAMEDSSWNTVPNKRSRKKTANSNNGDSVGDDTPETTIKAGKQPVKESEPAPAPAIIPNGRTVEPIGMPSIYENLNNPNDSEWSVV